MLHSVSESVLIAKAPINRNGLTNVAYGLPVGFGDSLKEALMVLYFCRYERRDREVAIPCLPHNHSSRQVLSPRFNRDMNLASYDMSFISESDVHAVVAHDWRFDAWIISDIYNGSLSAD